MALKFSVDIRNARLDVIETTIGESPVLKIRSGAAPANVAAADSGDILATLDLPADWMAAADAGAKAKSGTWQDLLADLGGTAGHFRIYASGGAPQVQGTCTLAGDGGDMILNTLTLVQNETFTVSTFNLTEGNA
jgi:hypothetical protein